MTIPKQVQKQADDAEKLAQEHLGHKPADGKQPAAKATPAVKPVPAPAEDWKKRFTGLKKSYDKVVPDLRTQITALQAELDRLKTTATPTPAAPISKEDISAVLTDQEKADYSPEFIDMVSRVATRIAGNGAGDSALVSRVSHLEQKVTRTDEETFWDAINDAIPNWRALQATDEMNGWLLEHDDALGCTRNEAIAQAQSTLDSQRVIAIFNQYSAPAPKTLMDDEEADLIIPDEGAGDGGAPLSPNQDIWTVSQVQQFYTELATGKRYKGKAGRERAAQIEKSIENARAEDRIVQG